MICSRVASLYIVILFEFQSVRTGNHCVLHAKSDPLWSKNQSQSTQFIFHPFLFDHRPQNVDDLHGVGVVFTPWCYGILY